MLGIRLIIVPINNKYADIESSYSSVLFMPKYPIKKDSELPNMNIVATILNKRSLSPSMGLSVVAKMIPSLFLSRSRPNFLDAKNNVVMGTIKNATVSLGKWVTPISAGTVSVDTPRNKGNIMDINKYFPCLLRRVFGSIFFHQRISTIRLAATNTE